MDDKGQAVCVCLCIVWLEDIDCLWDDSWGDFFFFQCWLKLICLYFLCSPKRQHQTQVNTFSIFSYYTDLEIRGLTQDIVADVQVALR